MNSSSNAIPETSVHAQAIPSAATVPASRIFLWSVKREIWERRSIYIAPLAVAAFLLLGDIISTVHLPAKMRVAMTLDPMKQHMAITQHYDLVALAIMGATFLVGIFYCLDALSSERRDRSILFWKSLPVSDLTTVLSKATISLVVLPLITFAVTVVTQLIMLMWNSAVLLANGLSVSTLWAQVSPFHTWMGLLFHLVAVHSLYYSPIFAWFLLVSAWARRAAFLWAFLPLFAIAALEKIAFNTSHFAAMLGDRVGGGADTGSTQGISAMDSMMHAHPGHFLLSPGLWVGLVLAAVFLVIAVRLRRSHGPI